MVQYWESFEKLEAYARNRNASHLPAWQQFNKNVGSNGDVGIWHETYLIEKGNYECIYNNMPRFGLGKVGEFVEAKATITTQKTDWWRLEKRFDLVKVLIQFLLCLKLPRHGTCCFTCPVIE